MAEFKKPLFIIESKKKENLKSYFDFSGKISVADSVTDFFDKIYLLSNNFKEYEKRGGESFNSFKEYYGIEKVKNSNMKKYQKVIEGYCE